MSIEASWRRSQLHGVRPEIAVDVVPSAPLVEADERLVTMVQPILDQLLDNLQGANAALVLADHRSVILDRRSTTRSVGSTMDEFAIASGSAFGEGDVGTNAIGTAAEERRLVRVAGAEHYADIFKQFSCYGVPLIHPLHRRLVGVLDLTFPPEDDHPAIATFMRDAARRIEGVLAEWAAVRERAQFDSFLTLGRRNRRAVVSVMGDDVLFNKWARRLDPADQATLLGCASSVVERDHGSVYRVELGVDRLPMEVKVHTRSDDAHFAGVILEVMPAPPRRRASRSTHEPDVAGLVGTSPAWIGLVRELDAVDGAVFPVLLIGAPGVGKYAVAQALHARSGRAGLVTADVATVAADGTGTWLRTLRAALASDDTTVLIRHLHRCDATLAAAIAAELDRVGAPDGRVVGTLTPEPSAVALRALVDRFGAQIVVPSLRDRADDVELLVQRFVERCGVADRVRFHPDTVATLRQAEYVDNVRELEAIVRRVAVARRGDVLPNDLPPLGHTSPRYLTMVERAERDAIVSAMRRSDGNKVAAAALLGISRPTLYRKLAAYQLG